MTLLNGRWYVGLICVTPFLGLIFPKQAAGTATANFTADHLSGSLDAHKEDIIMYAASSLYTGEFLYD